MKEKGKKRDQGKTGREGGRERERGGGKQGGGKEKERGEREGRAVPDLRVQEMPPEVSASTSDGGYRCLC